MSATICPGRQPQLRIDKEIYAGPNRFPSTALKGQLRGIQEVERVKGVYLLINHESIHVQGGPWSLASPSPASFKDSTYLSMYLVPNDTKVPRIVVLPQIA